MKRPSRELVGALAVLVLATGVAAVTVVSLVAGGGDDGELLGSVDLQSACDARYPGEDRVALTREETSAYTWVCESPTGGATASR